jgi:hypothetical protein
MSVELKSEIDKLREGAEKLIGLINKYQDSLSTQNPSSSDLQLEEKIHDLQGQLSVFLSFKKNGELPGNAPGDYSIQMTINGQVRNSIWERNRDYFLEHEKEFEERYPGLYVAVHENTVLATGENPGQLTGDMYRKYGNIPVYVSKPGNRHIVETINTPIESTQAEIDAQWENDRQFFCDHEKELESAYPNLYIAIYKGSVIGVDERLGELADRLYRTLGNIPFYADKPGEKDIEYLGYPLVD